MKRKDALTSVNFHENFRFLVGTVITFIIRIRREFFGLSSILQNTHTRINTQSLNTEFDYYIGISYFLQNATAKNTMRITNKHQPDHFLLLAFAFAVAILCCFCSSNSNSNSNSCEAFVATTTPVGTNRRTSSSCGKLYYNIYDEWRSDAVVDTMHLDEENVLSCLEEFIDSDYGTTIFGCHARAAVVGITGSIEFLEICGPEVTLSLDGKFWHKRSTVLGRAAMWLNARIPEITDVVVADVEDLKDVEEITDEYGDVLFRKDKRSEDFNGDRGTMEYQGCVKRKLRCLLACLRICVVLCV